MPKQLSKKLNIPCVVFLLVVVVGAGASAQNPLDSCKPVLTINATAFVARAKDTIISGTKARSILPEYMADGFKLRLTDTTYRIVQFRFGFWNARKGIYYEQMVQGDSLESAKLAVASREAVRGAARYFIDNIRVSRHNHCFWVNGVTYSTPYNPSPNLPARRQSSSPHTP